MLDREIAQQLKSASKDESARGACTIETTRDKIGLALALEGVSDATTSCSSVSGSTELRRCAGGLIGRR